jgi:hypothetical protein
VRFTPSSEEGGRQARLDHALHTKPSMQAR